MRAQPIEDQDGQVIKRFVGWAETTRSALHKGKTVPACSWFVLTSFARKLCSIHRIRMIVGETKKTNGCDNHNYLYIALRLAYDLRLKHRNRVSVLLREIFLCERSLKSIFSIMHPSNGPECTTPDVSVNTYTLFSRLHRLDRSALEYFVKCICPLESDAREKGGIVYNPENVLNKPIDDCGTTPLRAAITFGDPALVLLLLRHGADPMRCERGDEVDNFPQKCAVGFVVDRLNIMAVFKDPRWAMPDTGASSKSKNEGEEKALACLSYFSRAVYLLDIRKSSKTVDTNTPHEKKFSKGIFFEVHPKVTEIVDMASFRQPPSLRHACRYAIRYAVSCAGKEKIPTALKTLPVPTVMQQFLDLKF